MDPNKWHTHIEISIDIFWPWRTFWQFGPMSSGCCCCCADYRNNTNSAPLLLLLLLIMAATTSITTIPKEASWMGTELMRYQRPTAWDHTSLHHDSFSQIESRILTILILEQSQSTQNFRGFSISDTKFFAQSAQAKFYMKEGPTPHKKRKKEKKKKNNNNNNNNNKNTQKLNR